MPSLAQLHRTWKPAKIILGRLLRVCSWVCASITTLPMMTHEQTLRWELKAMRKSVSKRTRKSHGDFLTLYKEVSKTDIWGRLLLKGLLKMLTLSGHPGRWWWAKRMAHSLASLEQPWVCCEPWSRPGKGGSATYKQNTNMKIFNTVIQVDCR